jgi:hypothetical protein
MLDERLLRVSAPALGAGGPEFKSRRPDQNICFASRLALLNRGRARILRHLVGLAVHSLQGLSLHLRILLEDLCIALSKGLCNLLIGDVACTEPHRKVERRL